VDSVSLEQPLAAPAPAAPAVAKPVYVPSPRLANVERFRIIAMLEIVCFHDTHGRIPLIAGLGLPTFLLLTNVFNCTLTEKRGFGPFVRDKFNRLALPWLFWSAVYGSFLVFGALRRGIPLGEVLTPNMLLTGTYAHLWFVPFALFCGVLVGSIQYATKNRYNWLIVSAAFVIGVALVLNAVRLNGNTYEAPLPQWIFSLPAPFLGFVAGRAILTKDPIFLRNVLWTMAGVAFLGWLYTVAVTPDFTLHRYAFSVLLVVAALTWAGKADPLSKYVAPLLFGIYLVHPIIEKGLAKLPYIGDSQYLFLLDFVVTAFVVYGLKRTPLRRFV
jgi:surface polysaccharide O-acyltransferase-like enzyme